MSHAVYWAGIPCALDPRAPTRYAHARGLEPATATVAIPRRLFSTLVPTEPADPFALADPVSPALLSYLNFPTPAGEPPPVPMPFVGDLLVVQDDGDGTLRVTVHQRQMYFAGATVVDPEHQDRASGAADPLLAIELVGIQDFWDDHGEITEEWNRVRGPVEPRAAADYRGSVDTGTQAELDSKRYTAPSSRDGGRRAAPLREILQACFNALPGKLQIARWPAATPLVEDLRGWGASPKEIIKALCKHHGLHPDVGPDLGVRIFLRGEGVIGEAAGQGGALGADNDQAHDPETGAGAWSSAVAADRFLRRSTRRPDQVLVVGDRTIMDAAVDWCRPVLYYQETPDPAGGRRAPAPVVLEVRPENLALLASGRAPAEAEAGDELSEFLLSLTPSDAAGIVSPFPPTASTPPPELARLTWQRLLLVGNDDERWHEVVPGMPEQVRDQLQAQLGWVYQLPPEFRRLLPLADRAAVDHRGKRLPMMVEAFGFRAIRSRGKRPPRPAGTIGDLEGGLPGAEAAARKELTDELAKIKREIEEDRKRIKLLTGPTSEELLVALDKHVKREKAAGTSSFFGTLPAIAALDLESRLQRILGADPGIGYALVDALTFGNADPIPLPEDAEAAEVFARMRAAQYRLSNAFARRFGLGGFFGVPPEALDGDSVKAAIKEIEERIKRAEAAYRDVERKINPKLARQNELAAVEAEITRLRASGLAARELRNKALKLQEEIEQLEEDEAKAIAEEEKEVEIVTHVNLARRSVPYTVLDAALGIFRIDTPEPPVWLADPNVADPAETFAFFMPVRVTFGTMNGVDADRTSGGTQTGTAAPGATGPANPYLSQLAEALAEVPEMRDLVGTVGHALPDTVGERSTRFGFTRADLSGSANVDRARARRVTVQTTPPFRELVELGGRSNREQLRARAQAYARALLERPADVPDGSLVLRGPRNVLCNGVISAAEIRWVGPAGFVTEVSFHVDAEPLPGVEGDLNDPDAVRTVFGIDVEESRDR
jgi:hypothetical protein